MFRLFVILIFGSILNVNAQELNCLVIVNSDQIQNSNTQVYNTLQNAIVEYMNNTKWTNNNYKPQEKINCAITLNITEQPSSNEFKGNLSIQASRPVYNSTYQTPTLNFKDDQLLTKYRFLKFKVYDDLSGIKSYRGEIDGKWILLEYNAKKGLLTYDFNDRQLEGTKHSLKVIASDNVNNTNTYIATFYKKE